MAQTAEPERILITAAQLHGLLLGGPAPVVLDVRWALGDPHGREHFEAGRIPGSVYVDLDTELADPASPARGRHPLPAIGALQAAARRWGVDPDSAVVVLDDNGGLSAARAWWLLRWGGLRDVRLLDGGLGAWRRAGYELAGGPADEPAPGSVELTPGHLPVLTADETAELPCGGVLLDARAAERYRGESEPVDPRAGHIPGALSAPTAGNLNADGTFLDPGALRERFARLGADGTRPVGVYCGSGVTAAHEIAALALAGVPGALYPGSWSQWSADPSRPAALGPNAAPERGETG